MISGRKSLLSTISQYDFSVYLPRIACIRTIKHCLAHVSMLDDGSMSHLLWPHLVEMSYSKRSQPSKTWNGGRYITGSTVYSTRGRFCCYYSNYGEVHALPLPSIFYALLAGSGLDIIHECAEEVWHGDVGRVVRLRNHKLEHARFSNNNNTRTPRY